MSKLCLTQAFNITVGIMEQGMF